MLRQAAGRSAPVTLEELAAADALIQAMLDAPNAAEFIAQHRDEFPDVLAPLLAYRVSLANAEGQTLLAEVLQLALTNLGGTFSNVAITTSFERSPTGEFPALRARLGRLLGLPAALDESDLAAAQISLSKMLDHPAILNLDRNCVSRLPPATLPLLLHYLGEAWSRGNGSLAEVLEHLYAEIARQHGAVSPLAAELPDFRVPFASCAVASLTAGRAAHPVFEHFRCWEGLVPAGYNTDMLGAMIQLRFLVKASKLDQPQYVRTVLPSVNEEYFEYVDVLESVLAASGQFTMIELGAGFGRWLVRAACAARSTTRVACRLIGVEAEPEHFQWMKMHFRDNGIDPDQHRLIEAAASGQDGEVLFHVGNAVEWYGQAIASSQAQQSETIRRVPAISLQSLLAPLERVDLIDLDVQGAELEVLAAAASSLSTKVRRVHIGTHSSELEAGLRRLFYGLGWLCLNDYPMQSRSKTPFGSVEFGDGVQTWLNPRSV